jgi:transposase
MKIVTIKQLLENSTVEEIGEVSFSDDEILLFRKFIDNLSRLKEVKFFTEETPGVKKILWNGDVYLDFSSDLNEQDLHKLFHLIQELLYLLRPFILVQHFPASFKVIKDTFAKTETQTNEQTLLKLHLKNISDFYHKGLFQPLLQVTINKIELFSKETLNYWLNGIGYHQNEDENIWVKRLEKVFLEKTTRSILIYQLFGKEKAVFMLGELVNSVINSGEIILVKDLSSSI